ncbi:MAG: IS1380 family transposase [Proteobacteria bacterium]|nr:IS1380 family transposase [Pseudomonadota bacterium]
MANNTIKQGVLFKELDKKNVVVQFDQEHASSDGGAVLLKSLDDRIKLSETLAACLSDTRQQSKVLHSLPELFRQRLFGIACGYEDANDAARLGNDPVFKLLTGRDVIDGETLASQPTLSRFENGVRRADVLRMAEGLAETVINRHKRRKKKAKLITIDLDPTEDPAHGSQQLSLFNRFYDCNCYLPLAGFLTFDEEPEQYLFCYLLRPGNASAKLGCLGMLKRLLPRLRKSFPRARIRIRLDSGFTGPELYAFFEAQGLEYVVGMGKNSVLLQLAEPAMDVIRADADNDIESICYDEARYAASSWPHERRVIIKGQITYHEGRKPKENPRFVITNVKGSPQHIYEKIYCARGDAENRIKELKDGLQIDRTSCTSFLANQLRVLLTAAAYVLFQELRLHARHTGHARAQVTTLRLHLIKLGAWVESSVRRIVMHLPTSMPYIDDWRHIARSVGAFPT